MPKRTTGNDRRLRWGDGWIDERATRDGTAYLARWREPDPATGKTRTRSKSFRDLAAAEAHLRDVADKQSRGAYVPPERTTVDQLVTAFLDRAATRLTPGTLGQWRSRHKSLISPYLGGVLLSALTTPRVQHWIDQLVRRGLAAETIVGGRRVLLGACKEAVVLGALTTNPVSGTKAPAVRVKPVEVWTDEEVRRVLAVVAGDPLLNAAYRLSLSTGIRPGELLALRWSDLDLKAGTLTVRRTRTLDEHTREVERESTKGKRTRVLSLIPSTVAALKAWKKAQAEMRLQAPSWAEPDRVLTSGDGGWITRGTWGERQDLVVVVAGVRRITPHGTRHSYATLELSAGTHPRIVQERLGHSSITITMDRYTHVSVDLQRAATQALERSLFGEGDVERDAIPESQ